MFFMVDDLPSACTSLAGIWQIVGWVLFVFKIVVPILIIIFGMFDLGKAVVADKDDEIKKSVKSLAMRAIAGLVIFFIPTLVGVVFNFVGSVKGEGYDEEYAKCKSCIVSPYGNTCKQYACEADETKTWSSNNTCVAK